MARALRSLTRITLAAAIVYALVVGTVYAFQREMVFPRRFVNAIPFQAMLGEEFERLTIVTADGESLKAYWKPPEDGAPVVVSFHGNGSVPEPLAARFGRAPWSEAGFGVLAFAYRGYPGSTGTPSEHGLIEDGEAAMRFVHERAAGHPVVLHGHSLGTGVAVAMSERHRTLGLVLEAPFSSLPDVVSVMMPFLPGFLMLDTFVSQRRIAGSQAEAIIVTHGERDPVIPAVLGRRLFAAAPHGLFLDIVDADHMSLLGVRDAEIVDILANGYPSAEAVVVALADAEVPHIE